MADVTRIINAIQQGNKGATDELLPLVYEELRRLAAQKLSHEKPGQTLQPTALVHEVYLRLIGQTNQNWDGRGHFFAAGPKRCGVSSLRTPDGRTGPGKGATGSVSS